MYTSHVQGDQFLSMFGHDGYSHNSIIFEILRLCEMYTSPPGGGGLPPYMAYAGMRRWTGYGFRPLCPKQGI